VTMVQRTLRKPTHRREKRALVVAYTEYPYDPRVRQEARILVTDGYQVHVVAVRAASGFSRDHLDGVHLYELPLTIRRGGKARYVYQYVLFFLMSTVLMLKLFLRVRFTLVHVHSLPDFQVFSALPFKLARVPILLDLHEAMPELLIARFHKTKESIWFRLACLVEQLSCRFADHVIAANDGIRCAIVARGIPPSHVTAVYNAYQVLEPMVDPENLRQRLKLPQGKIIVHAGGINPERDLETVIRALALVSNSIDVHFVVAGSGEPGYVASLKRLAEALGIGDRVLFIGKLLHEEARALMSLSEVGLVSLERNPLTELAWPIRVVEYAYLGKPLVVPTLHFLRETLHGAARYYLAGDPTDLSRVLMAVLTGRKKTESSAARADRILQDPAWLTVNETFLAVCRGFRWHTLEEDL